MKKLLLSALSLVALLSNAQTATETSFELNQEYNLETMSWDTTELRLENVIYSTADSVLLEFNEKQWNYVGGNNFEQHAFSQYYANLKLSDIENQGRTGIISLDSALIYAPAANGDWQLSMKQQSTFDENGKVLSIATMVDAELLFGVPLGFIALTTRNVIYSGDTVIATLTTGFGGALVDSVKYTYDENGYISMIEEFEWDDDMEMWMAEGKEIYENNANGDHTSLVEYYYDEETEQLVLSYKEELIYEGTDLVSETSFYWDISENDFVQNNKTEYTLNENGDDIVVTHYSYDGSDWEMSGIDSTYYSGDDKTYEISYALDGEVYVPRSRTIYLESLTFNEVSPFPGAPSNLAIIETAPNSGIILRTAAPGYIMLEWTDNSDNEEGFMIERSEDGVQFSPVGVIEADETTFTDYAVEDQTNYIYRVSAYRDAFKSTSNTVTGNTLSRIVGLNKQEVEVALTVFPNPVANELKVLSPVAIVEIQLFNTLGELVKTTTSNTVDVSDEQKGTYLLLIKDVEGNTFTKSVVKN